MSVDKPMPFSREEKSSNPDLLLPLGVKDVVVVEEGGIVFARVPRVRPMDQDTGNDQLGLEEVQVHAASQPSH
jgi:hypothetical protein